MEEEAKYSKHFSHEHPLEYIDPCFQKSRSVCAACKHAIARTSFFYQCKLCEFSLHKVCYTMPKKVTHPSDQNHYLTLQCITDESNDCKACGRHIGGFYYSCTKCSLYCHMLCVALPLSVKIPSSHPHMLKLELELPYDFRCDMCDRPSYSGWLYRCRLCEFDAHVSCAVKGTQSPHQRRVSDNKSHQHELMELLSQVMKGNEVKSLDHDHDQSVPVSEDLTMPSYQFSDACFSIDISNFSRHQVKVPGLKETEGVRRQTGIGSHVWEELGPGDKLKLKDVENLRQAGKKLA
ncbi:hypothetical protein ACS0TY_034516 [Phlomoides rotata]